MRGCSVYADDGAPLQSAGTIQDISQRLLTEQKLKEIAVDLARAQRIAKIGNWSYRVADGHIAWSEQLYRIFGRTHHPKLSYDLLMSWIHPLDRPLHEAYFRKMLAITPNQALEKLQYRLVRPGGEERWVEISFECEFDPQGHPLRFFGTLQDINRRKRAEEELRASEERFREFTENAQ